MKKYLILSVVTVLLISMSAFIPKAVDNIITNVEVVTMRDDVKNEDIFTSGSIEEISKRDIFVELPIVPEKVNVEIGDFINAQDVIATVDTTATQAALYNLAQSLDFIPQEYMEVIGSINISEQLVKDYIPTEIVSPTSGKVTAINLIPGAISMPKTTVCTISKTDWIRVKMTVDEMYADKVAVNDIVVFKASATGDTKYTGKVERVFPTASKTISGTSQATVVGIYVELDKEYSRLKPGYTVNGVIKKQSDKVVTTIPYEAVLQDKDNQEYVYIYQQGHAIRKDITTGKEFPDTVEIISGINSEDIVIKNAANIKHNNAIVKNIK